MLICHLTQRLHNQKHADEADLNKSATSAPHKLLESVLSRLLPPSVSMKFCFFHSLRQYVKTRTDSHEKTVNSDAEYQAFCKIADRHSHTVTEEKHPDVIQEERFKQPRK